MAPPNDRGENGDTFLRITNRDLYNEIVELKKTVAAYNLNTTRRIDHVSGNVSLLRWAVGAVGLACSIIFSMLLVHLFGIGL